MHRRAAGAATARDERKDDNDFIQQSIHFYTTCTSIGEAHMHFIVSKRTQNWHYQEYVFVIVENLEFDW